MNIFNYILTAYSSPPIKTKIKMTSHTPRNPRRRYTSSGESISLSQVTAGRVGRHAIAPQPVPASSSDERLNQMSLDLKGIITQLASMDCKVGKLMDGQRRNIGAAARQESMPASLPALAPSSSLPVPAMSEQEMSSVILEISGPAWWYQKSEITTSNTIALLTPQCNKMQQDGAMHALTVILACHTHTYLTNWRLIDNEMGLEVGLLSEMSDSESDVEDMNVATVHVLRIKCPSWRSNEINYFWLCTDDKIKI
ncbi:hypothetical protein J3Q64DRAFT_1702131 [Phycomyces blakesleeanus]|uniref:Uncharacterized protein n=2 Tax=Phycomyces blakesleeanus TaxID=4837 RepID=A0A167RB85_PHYB8|nr:hypothetical protein PHYBLDRAFT_161886 [Phycomyces blakesleeanus NRRL 1555(-)]OAD81269.1 hypothetical protein PHYBLDRAFT_161886 [Phycomyces blakesleeanus NRRL 1555(-)]|eukprot:XP_018299309.1 hypothetical protein PHYBLDRAFT_161886 [Phycomyces blakesleeanus NRRL 1555(-)]